MNHTTPDLRVGEEPRILRVGLLSGACADCGEKQSTELLSLDIINSTNCHREGRGGREGRRGKGSGGMHQLHTLQGTSLVLHVVHKSKSLRRVGAYTHSRKPLLAEQVPDPYHLFGIVGQDTNMLLL